MKNIIVAILALLYSPSLFAQTIRDISEGEDCEKVVEIESSHGSKILDKSDNFLHFYGMHFGRKSIITYVCKNGLVKAQHIKISPQDETTALKVYYEIYWSLCNKLSAPPSREESGGDLSWEKVSAWAPRGETILLLVHESEAGPEVTVNRVWRYGSKETQ